MRSAKILTKISASIEAIIVTLANERKHIDNQLRILTATLGALEAPPSSRKNGKSKKRVTPKKRGDLMKLALSFLNTHDEVNPLQLATHLGCHRNYAYVMLTKFARRIRPGVYCRRK